MKKWINLMLSTMMLQMKQSFARSMFQFCLIANPIVNTIFLYEMFQNSGEENFIQYVVLGAGLMGIWSCICFSSAGDINRERFSGTLPLIYVAPAGFGTIIFGKILGNTVLSMVTFLISYLVAFGLTGTPMGLQYPGKFLAALGITIVCFVVVSLCIAYVLMLSRKTELYMNLIEIPFILVCGFAFPVEILPDWVQFFSNLLPPTWAVRILRASVTGENCFSATICWVVLLTELAVLVVVTRVLYLWMEKRSRIKATLEVS